jgi:hypothetical protein
MLRIRTLAFAAVAVLGLAGDTIQAGGWGVRIGIGFPIYAGPYCYHPYYYRPYYPVYVEPVPVVVQPAPVYQAVPPAPASRYQDPPASPEPLPVPRPIPAQTVAPTSGTGQPRTIDQRQLDIENHLRLLASSSEKARADAAMRLGRLRAERAIDPLAATLAGDASAEVREAAARSLGLIGSTKALPALRRAAEADSDKEVRHSAAFAVDVVQVTTGR